MKKGWIIAGLLIVIGGSAYLLFSKKGDSKTSDNTSGDDTSGGGTTDGGGTTGGGGTTTKSNFDRLKQNIGSNFTNLRGGSAISVNFNNNKNFAQFYTNNRLAIFTKSNNKLFIKGNYANGGKKIVLDNGRTIESGSVWTNLNNTVR